MEAISTSRNRVLNALSRESRARLEPHLASVDLSQRDSLTVAGERPDAAFFIEDGFASVVIKGPEGRSAEVGMVGCEGATAIPIILADDRWPHDTFVQHKGRARRIDSGALLEAMERDADLRRALLRMAHAFLLQLSHSLLAKNYATIEERTARWLAMAHDRVDGDELFLVHEFLAMMLGVRRASVTDALHGLEGKQSIRADRGRITVIDRAKLNAQTGGFYGLAEREQDRLIG